ncbi:hypothetical protein CAEBREN_17558 [Caenorhabditis brenneri]|uniref:Uncharacterized protein n=1 Tax=Caenorhabditis brenneri TaxID=135651 RepID=G0NSB8_CAEBE|nr:hypothetical protein CAEBREN_17558 [Caenorhabditis brenneri]
MSKKEPKMSKKRPKYAATKPRYLDAVDMLLSFNEAQCMTTWKCICKDGSELVSNFRGDYEKIKKNTNFKYWVADSQDIRQLDKACPNKELEDAKFSELLMSSMTNFTNKFQKQIYIRSIPPAIYGSSDERRMFPDEVFEAIPILLKQQKTPIKKNDKRLLKYREQWKNPADHLYKTMRNSEFLKILEEFDIDKTKVKVIQSPGHELCRLRLIQTGMDPIKLFSPDKELVLDTTQAVSMVFQGLVYGVNWETDQCDVHENCLEGLKPKFIALMKEYMAIEKGTYIAVKHVIAAILKLKASCKLSPSPPPKLMLNEHPPNQKCPIDPYIKVADHFNLPVYLNFEFSIEDSIPVWMVRVFMKFGWIQQFFDGDEEKELQDLLIKSVLFLVPEQKARMTEHFMKNPDVLGKK